MKLPDSLLNNLSTDLAEPVPEHLQHIDSENKIKIFDSDAESDVDDDMDASSTQFNIVTKKDLNSDKYRSSEAWNFREKMLFGSRIRREVHSQKSIQKMKQVSVKGTKISVKT